MEMFTCTLKKMTETKFFLKYENDMTSYVLTSNLNDKSYNIAVVVM